MSCHLLCMCTVYDGIGTKLRHEKINRPNICLVNLSTLQLHKDPQLKRLFQHISIKNTTILNFYLHKLKIFYSNWKKFLFCSFKSEDFLITIGFKNAKNTFGMFVYVQWRCDGMTNLYIALYRVDKKKKT